MVLFAAHGGQEGDGRLHMKKVSNLQPTLLSGPSQVPAYSIVLLLPLPPVCLLFTPPRQHIYVKTLTF